MNYLKMRKTLINALLLSGPISWVARLGVWVRDIQLRWVFQSK